VGGVGGLTLFTDTAVTNLGVIANETYFAGNLGGGVKWFATRLPRGYTFEVEATAGGTSLPARGAFSLMVKDPRGG
jgi:hypothetical protein